MSEKETKNNIQEAPYLHMPLKYEITLSTKVHGKADFSMASAEIKSYVGVDTDYETALDETKEKLEEAIAAALIVTDKYGGLTGNVANK